MHNHNHHQNYVIEKNPYRVVDSVIQSCTYLDSSSRLLHMHTYSNPKTPTTNQTTPPIMFQCISNAVVQKQLIGSNDQGVCEVPKSWRCDRVGRAVIDIRIESVHNGTEST